MIFIQYNKGNKILCTIKEVSLSAPLDISGNPSSLYSGQRRAGGDSGSPSSRRRIWSIPHPSPAAPAAGACGITGSAFRVSRSGCGRRCRGGKGGSVALFEFCGFPSSASSPAVLMGCRLPPLPMLPPASAGAYAVAQEAGVQILLAVFGVDGIGADPRRWLCSGGLPAPSASSIPRRWTEDGGGFVGGFLAAVRCASSGGVRR